MAKIYMNDITTSTATTAYVDLSTIRNIKVYNLDATNTITISFGAATDVATEKIILAVKESGIQAEAVPMPESAKGGLLYYTSDANTPVLRIIGERF